MTTIDDHLSTLRAALAVNPSHLMAPSIAAVCDELERARVQICRLVSGQAIESDHMCQHHDADVAALADVASLRAELAESNRQLSDAVAARDNMEHARDMVIANRDGLVVERDAVAAERDRLRVELIGLCHALGCPNDQQSCIDAIDALRAEVDKLRARPGLDSDVEQLRCDLQSCRDENSTLIDRIAKVRAEAKRASDGRDAFCEAVMAALGSDDSTADVLASIEALKSERAQFKVEVAGLRAAAEQASAISREREASIAELRARPVLTDERLRIALCNERVRFIGHDGLSSLFDHLRADYQADALDGLMAKLGAVTLPLPAQDRAEDLAAALQDERCGLAHEAKWSDADPRYKHRCVREMSRALVSLGAPATTPSKPADVFAGVSIEELVVEYLMAGDPSLDRGVARELVSGVRVAGIRAVLDALRVKLVAPVDPEEVARAYHNHDDAPAESWSIIVEDDDRTAGNAARAMRSTLTAKGIPVTPEAGK